MTYEEQPEAAVVADLASAGAPPNEKAIDPDATPLVLVRESMGSGDSRVRVLDLQKYATRPERRSGAVEFDEPASFVSYVNEFKDSDETRFYASLVEPQALAILNDDNADLDAESNGAWRDHVAMLRLQRTPEWQRWLESDTQMMTQVEFAEFLELNLRDVTEPDAATLIEIARSFTVSSEVQYRSAQRLASGETAFAYDEQHQTSAGGTKSVAVPEAFLLHIAPFRGTPKIDVIARLRYRLRGSALLLGYLIDNPGDIERDGFRSIVEKVGEDIGLPVLYGRPASPPRER